MKKSCWLLSLILFVWICGCTPNSDRGSVSDKETAPVEEMPYEFDVLRVVEHKVVTNYHIWIKDTAFTKEGLTKFARLFRERSCSGQCNISFYDTDKIAKDIDNFDLEGKDYLYFADHFIGNSSFEMPNEPIWWYMYQDAKYRDLGGKNWKKEPIK